MQTIHDLIAKGNNLAPSERVLMYALIKKFEAKDIKDLKRFQQGLYDLFRGAYVKFYDNGALYHYLHSNIEESSERISSQKSSRAQFSFWGGTVHECLYSTVKLTDEEKKQHPEITEASWFQLERHHTKDFQNLIKHIGDFFMYVASGKNVGPCGMSEYTEENPLIWPPTARM